MKVLKDKVADQVWDMMLFLCGLERIHFLVDRIRRVTSVLRQSRTNRYLVFNTSISMSVNA